MLEKLPIIVAEDPTTTGTATGEVAISTPAVIPPPTMAPAPIKSLDNSITYNYSFTILSSERSIGLSSKISFQISV